MTYANPATATTTPPGATGGLSASASAPPARGPRRGLQQTLIYTVLVAGALILMIPFAWMVSSSLKTEEEAQRSSLEWETLLPATPQWHNYPDALARMDFTSALANTVVITVCCVIGQILSSSIVGYGFARLRFRGRDAVFLLMLATIMLPAQITMIPVFILFRSLGWIDTLLPLIVPAWLASPFFVFLFRQFFAQVPEDLIEAARVDGASHWRIYWSLMLPLSKPVIAIVAIYTFMFTWNDFLAPLIYLHSPENATLTLALNRFRDQYGVANAHLLMAAACVTLLPCVILFFAAQRYFVQSVASTGLKG